MVRQNNTNTTNNSNNSNSTNVTKLWEWKWISSFELYFGFIEGSLQTFPIQGLLNDCGKDIGSQRIAL